MKAAARLIYPYLCAGCTYPCIHPLCNRCLAGLPRPRVPSCRACGGGAGIGCGGCRGCRSKGFEFDRAGQAFAFTGAVRVLIHRFKYKGEWAMAEYLAGLMVAEGLEPRGVVTWVPGSRSRNRSRGFDHCEMLATAFGSSCAVPFADLLERTRETVPQARLDPALRRKNLSGAFRARIPSPDLVTLVDDVFTTGATCNEAAKALKSAGAVRITALALARALPALDRGTYNSTGFPAGSVVAED